jgi:hypothetical protein
MPLSKYDSKERVEKTINYLITHKTEIKVKIDGHATPFVSRISKVNYGDASSKMVKVGGLIMERLVPEEGNAQIKSGSHLDVLFSLRGLASRFSTQCLHPPSKEPDEDLIVSFPKSIEIRERRRRDRRGEGIPDFTHVVVKLMDDSQKEKTFKLEVLDRSEFGVGILLRNEDAEMLERIEVGDKLRDMTLYGSYAMMKVKGTVTHKTKRDVDGDQFHVVGVEFEETLEQLSAFRKR